jgi:hypothetical protein
MASKVDENIARVAVAIGSRDHSEMDRVAAEVASTLKPKDLEKLPEKWYPVVGAKKANAPELLDSWCHLWFEATAELLYQKKAEGLAGLLVLMDRNECTYHSFVIVRLLRLAADGVDRETILERIRTRLTTLHCVQTRSSVREVTYFKMTDPRPLELLWQMADIVAPNSDGDTVGLYLEQMGEELPVHLARMEEQAG